MGSHRYASVSVDGFIADENDQPGPLFDWLVSGDAVGRERRVEGVADVLRLRPAVLGPDRGDDRRPPRLRHDGRLGRDTSGWDRPRGRRDRRSPRAGTSRRRFTSSTASKQPWPRRKSLRVTAGRGRRDVGQVLAAGLVDEVRMDVVPVVFGPASATSVGPRAAPLEDPDVVIQGNRVLHLLSGAPLTDPSGYAKKSTANGDTRSGLRRRLRIAVPGRAADADPPQHLTCWFNPRSLVAGSAVSWATLSAITLN